eukprot:224208_1
MKTAEKNIGRIGYVDDQASKGTLFRIIRFLAPVKNEPNAIYAPSKWFQPMRFNEMIEEMDELTAVWEASKKTTPMPGRQFADELVIIDMDSIRAIQEAVSKCGLLNAKGEPKTMNNITLGSSNSILTKYIDTNHMTDLKSSDIDEMKTYEIDFDHVNYDSMNALQLYVQQCKGELDKDVIQSLVKGGCPINWTMKPKEGEDDDADQDDDDDKDEEKDGKKPEKKREMVPVRVNYAPLHRHCQLPESNLNGFKILIECGADIELESRDNQTAIYYLLKLSHHVNAAFIAYLVNECKINLNCRMEDAYGPGTTFFNFWLSNNEQISRETVTAFCDIAGCDASSHDASHDDSNDDDNNTNSLMSYMLNHKRKFDLDVIKCLVESGANINEPNINGKYPIQYALQIEFTPLATLMKYARYMIDCGAKIEHILADDPVSIEDNKLYILQKMKDGYEMYDGMWCRIEGWSFGSKYIQKLQSAIALDRFGATKLFIRLKRTNLIEITQEMLIDQYPEFASVFANEEDEEDDQKEEFAQKDKE